MAKQNGSLLFSTANISTEEYVLMAKVISKETGNTEIIEANIRAFDDMIGIMKIQSIIGRMRRTKTGKFRKNSSMQEILMNRIGQLVEEEKNINHNA